MIRLRWRWAFVGAIAFTLACGTGMPSVAATAPEPDTIKQRSQLYERIRLLTGLNWSLIAAIDQYERTMSRAHPKARPIRENAVTGAYIPPSKWSGVLNPDDQDTEPASIRFFHGIGRDGSGDRKADRHSDADLLYSIAAEVLRYGSVQEDFAIGLWEYYQNTRAVQRILQFAKLYHTIGRLDLSGNAFPLPLKSDYSFRSTWGNSRSWGGYRIHEGTDIFARHGVAVRSTVYGIVEIKGWNRYGGWRIGIRDINNQYHYYAHLSGFMIEHDLAPAPTLAAPEGYFLEGLRRLYSRPVRMNALRIVAASALAGWLAAGAGLEHPLWASMGAIAAMQGLNYKQTVQRGIQRLVGNVGGAVVAAGLIALTLGYWQAVAVIVILQTAAELLVIKNYALTSLAVTPMALLLIGFSAPIGTEAAVARVADTLIGVVIGIVVAAVTISRSDRHHVTV